MFKRSIGPNIQVCEHEKRGPASVRCGAMLYHSLREDLEIVNKRLLPRFLQD